MTTERELVANLYSAALAFDDAQGAEYVAGAPAHSEEASARTASAGYDLRTAFLELFQPGTEISREPFIRAGLREDEIDFIVVQLVQAPYEITSNEMDERDHRLAQLFDSAGMEFPTRETYARSVATALTRDPANSAAIEAEMDQARALAPSDSAANTNGVMRATLGNTLEREALVELPGHRVQFKMPLMP